MSHYQSLKGKNALIFGLGSDKSLAWGIAKALHQQGCALGFSFLNEKFKRRVFPLAESLNAKLIEPLDVNNLEEIKTFFQKTKDTFDQIDILVHSLAYAPTEDLEGRFIDTSCEGFLTAMKTSVYSLISLAKFAQPLMKNGGSVVTLTYLGSQRVVPHYNVMGVCKAALEASVRYLAYDLGRQGIRVNAISAGPIKTLSALGIKGFKDMLSKNEEHVPLKENITIEDVGSMATYLCGDTGKHVTGTTMYLDSGAHIL